MSEKRYPELHDQYAMYATTGGTFNGRLFRCRCGCPKEMRSGFLGESSITLVKQTRETPESEWKDME